MLNGKGAKFSDINMLLLSNLLNNLLFAILCHLMLDNYEYKIVLCFS